METSNIQSIIENLFLNIHWLPVLTMTIFSFALGALWHSPLLFGKIWKQLNNYSAEKKDLNMPLIFGGTAIMNLISLAGLNAFIADQGCVAGLVWGILVSVVWILPALCATYLFANKSLKLVAIDAGMYIVLFCISGLVFGIW